MENVDLSSSHIVSQQEKLDALFGITDGEDLDTFLSGLSLDQAVSQRDEALSAIEQLSAAEELMQSKMAELKAIPTTCSSPTNLLSVQMSSTEHSLKELEDIIDLSKDIIRHVHQSILATPLIDSEAVQAYGKLVESIHISIAEFIGVYRDKQNFINKVKFALLQQDQKKELMRYKTDLAIEILHAKEGPKSIEADAIETHQSEWNVDNVVKLLDRANVSAETANIQ